MGNCNNFVTGWSLSRKHLKNHKVVRLIPPIRNCLPDVAERIVGTVNTLITGTTTDAASASCRSTRTASGGRGPQRC